MGGNREEGAGGARRDITRTRARRTRDLTLTFVIPGYQRARAGSATIVALSSCLPELRGIVEQRRLHEFAGSQPGARTFRGRGPAYAVTLPGSCGNVVVRHAFRGGAVAAIVSDLYASRLRPLRELIASYRLRIVGVPTPELVAYVIYPAGPLFRYDVATREIADAHDLATILNHTADEEAKAAIIHAVARLLDELGEAGAHHSDLNARNVLLAPSASGFLAFVIDVDRVRFHVPRSPMVMSANLDRLERSLRKLRASGFRVTDAEIRDLRLRANDLHSRRRAAPDS